MKSEIKFKQFLNRLEQKAENPKQKLHDVRTPGPSQHGSKSSALKKALLAKLNAQTEGHPEAAESDEDSIPFQ